MASNRYNFKDSTKEYYRNLEFEHCLGCAMTDMKIRPLSVRYYMSGPGIVWSEGLTGSDRLLKTVCQKAKVIHRQMFEVSNLFFFNCTRKAIDCLIYYFFLMYN